MACNRFLPYRASRALSFRELRAYMIGNRFVIPRKEFDTAINDAHKRRQDREYRKAAEKRELNLKNEERELRNRILETEFLKGRIELAKSHGSNG
ncbi:MAG: hypothetical protein WAN65_10915 [Candidatus Sulfotelmatobacter sp.]